MVLVLGLVNISLGVFLAVLPLAVWLIWYIYLIILVLLLVILEILGFLRRRATRRGPSLKLKGRQRQRFTDLTSPSSATYRQSD